MTIEDMQKERASALEKAAIIRDLAKEDERDLSAEEVEKVTGLIDTADQLAEGIKTAEAAASVFERLDNGLEDIKKPAVAKTVDSAKAVTSEVRENAFDDPTRGFGNMGEYALSVFNASIPGGGFDNKLNFCAAASGMNQAVGAEGGFLVPPMFSQTIWDGLNKEPDNLMGMTQQFTVDGESLTFPANAETSRATGSRFGGAQGYWIAEADTITASTPKLRQVKLEPNELAVLIYATEKLLRNTTAATTYINNSAIGEIGFLVNDAIYNGTGAGQPLGVLNSGCLVSVAKEGGQAADTIVTANINKMYARLHPRARSSAVWFTNVDTHPQLAALKDENNQPLLLPSNGLEGRPVMTMKGLPVMEVEYAGTLGDKGDIMLADLGFYTTGIRSGGPSVAESIHFKFDTAQRAFRVLFEIDGQPWLASAITPFKGSNTLSPFVTLDERA